MYSVVLAISLTTGGDVTALGHGCNGGWYGCYGGSYSFGGGHGCRGGHHRANNCCSCYGGSYSSWGGCHGGHHGCRTGHRRGHGCCGCYGNYGYCGGYAGGNYGGCVGGFGGVGGIGGAVVPGAVVPNVAPTTTPAPSTTPGKKTSFEGAAPATLIVNVPADAQLTIDGQPTTSTSTQRVFVSPTLEAGRTFHYTLQAEINKDGKVIKVSKKVAVMAGEQSRVTLNADNIEFAAQ